MSSSVDEMLRNARTQLERLEPTTVAKAINSGALLVDIRPQRQRALEGEIPGSLIIERNVLEWRFDLQRPWHIEAVSSYDQSVVVFCSEGYTSSLAASALQQLGFKNATDMVGGFKAWRAADLPTQAGGTNAID